MTRDLDFIRELLARVAEEEFSSSDPVVIHHASLLKSAGLIHAVLTPQQWKDRFALAILKRLTPLGQQFLQASRDEAVWRQTKRIFVRPGLVFSLSMIADYLGKNPLPPPLP